MRKLLLIIFMIIPLSAQAQYDEPYPPIKMQIVVQEVLNAFKSQAISTSVLGKYISLEWLDENNLDVKDFKINSYAPTYYDIQLMFDRYVIAEIGGDSWSHLLVFKFINEDGVYRLIPRGISTVSEDYIDPWYEVKSYTRQDE